MYLPSTCLIAVAFTFVYSGSVTFILLKLVGIVTGGPRVSEEQESGGLDTASHGERAYS